MSILRFYSFLLMAIAAIFMVSCAKEVNESDDTVEQRYLAAYAEMNYSSVQPTASGLYFIPRSPRHGGTAPVPDNYVYMRYTSRSMDSTIIQTSVDSLATMLGTHSKRTYYGPQICSMAEGFGMIGIQEAFSYMKPADKARVLMPSWLSKYTSSSARSYNTTVMYDLELLRVVTDMAAFQTDSLKQYSNQKFSGVDSLKYDWYFVSTTAGDDVLPVAGDTIKIRYAGYFLDGFLFDTNIKSVAEAEYGKDVDASATYDELNIIMDSDVAKMGVVKGFAYALQRMSEGESATTFFSSAYGYGATNYNSIPACSMLRFDIQVTIGRKQ